MTAESGMNDARELTNEKQIICNCCFWCCFARTHIKCVEILFCFAEILSSFLWECFLSGFLYIVGLMWHFFSRLAVFRLSFGRKFWFYGTRGSLEFKILSRIMNGICLKQFKTLREKTCSKGSSRTCKRDYTALCKGVYGPAKEPINFQFKVSVNQKKKS